MHAPLPGWEYEPGVQSRHVADAAVEYVPIPQVTMPERSALGTVPAAASSHWLEPALLYVPSPHARQADAPTKLYSPAPHSTTPD